MLFQLVFHIPNYTKDHSSFPMPIGGGYSYWFPLLSFFLDKANTLEIHCWNEEIETIEEMQTLYKESFEIVAEENLTIFKAVKSDELKSYLLNNHLNDDGKLKWFTVNLDKGLTQVFHSGHWGTEFFVPTASEEDITFIESVTPIGTQMHQYR
ncbi:MULTISPECIES: hypothetical protein [unclassified Bacillus (in: firmicutes)]|uniref:hypothetical protein n=1 Tax=unclassified Bacillus (in: firmicutes) TaxID=185979 RepID=UPI0008E8D2CE|nr:MULTISPECIES: hypothetical protein [unclassified Bacillus (in: firmicutes)]SFB06741.1 hypothetical protein SAMN02799634_10541 [Bacillus sp. UNCCL13]SFQ87592.1 hypothetical protein SAMN04488577_3078 [Bacillus sp. cl95]